jgi:hypothetical protein
MHCKVSTKNTKRHEGFKSALREPVLSFIKNLSNDNLQKYLPFVPFVDLVDYAMPCNFGEKLKNLISPFWD